MPQCSKSPQLKASAISEESKANFKLKNLGKKQIGQQKKIKDHSAMVNAVQKGDEVVTGGGLIGKVTKASETNVTIDFGNGVVIKSLRSTLADVKKDK